MRGREGFLKEVLTGQGRDTLEPSNPTLSGPQLLQYVLGKGNWATSRADSDSHVLEGSGQRRPWGWGRGVAERPHLFLVLLGLGSFLSLQSELCCWVQPSSLSPPLLILRVPLLPPASSLVVGR